ncbi:MAG: hypothetical protein P8Y02_09410, partial [Deinococcales bacterium]
MLGLRVRVGSAALLVGLVLAVTGFNLGTAQCGSIGKVALSLVDVGGRPAPGSSVNPSSVSSTAVNSATELCSGNHTSATLYAASGYDFNGPFGVAADPSGNIWITNHYGDTVTELPAGNYTTPVVYAGSSYDFVMPIGIAVDANGNIWITSNHGNAVTELPAGDFTRPVVYSGSNYGFSDPFGVAVDPDGNIWITNENG